MRPVHRDKKRFGWKDFAKMFILIILHFLAIFAYAFCFLTLKNFLGNEPSWMLKLSLKNYPIVYFVLVAPLINAILHIIYLETGNIGYKATLWLHSLICIIAIPILMML